MTLPDLSIISSVNSKKLNRILAQAPGNAVGLNRSEGLNVYTEYLGK